MSAECCDHENDSEDKSNASQIKFWQVRELQLSFVAIVILMIGFVLERAEMELASSAFALLAGAIAGWTFIPGSIKGIQTQGRRWNIDDYRVLWCANPGTI